MLGDVNLDMWLGNDVDRYVHTMGTPWRRRTWLSYGCQRCPFVTLWHREHLEGLAVEEIRQHQLFQCGQIGAPA